MDDRILVPDHEDGRRQLASIEPERWWIEAFQCGPEGKPWHSSITGDRGPEIKGDRITWTFPEKDKQGAAQFLTVRCRLRQLPESKFGGQL